jgi:hypothetical protein
VLAETADFLPLERGGVTQQASVVLDTIADGVCITRPNGDLVWANRRLRDFPPSPVLAPLRDICIQRTSSSQPPSGRKGGGTRRFSLIPQGRDLF